MAHLIKIEDYTSRYQHDLQRYLGQFSRLKKEQWENMKREWTKANQTMSSEETYEESLDDWLEGTDSGFFTATLHRLKNLSGKSRKNEEDVEEKEQGHTYKDKSIEEVKELFYEDLFQAQLRWASASLLDESMLDPAYRYDPILRYFVRHLPDNYMIFYYPVFTVGKAPLEMDIILLSPTSIYCLSIINGDANSVFEPSSGRYWNEYVHKEIKRRINPVMSLNRMSSVLRSLLEDTSLQMNLRRIVMSPDSIIDNRLVSTKVETVDKRNIDEWFEKRKRNPSPIKKNQLYAADILLQYALTNSFRRRDLVDDNDAEE
ncbi:NERD domain-containing protein [Salibacterium salarium]|uniref:NERD domain-containing protein n=1 Tax=Salibacterium salarium TaxID=284579 RepID=A0A3R9QT82_9BACI|nr:nuclease-related domain-containing protein [Salibacterium salarium]RSL32896.1 NERD domain-containing protein [Salibacterium salarium]